MKIVIEINIDNAAFEDFNPEIERILDDIKDRLDYFGLKRPLVLRDINGNVVGEMNLIK